VRSELRRIDKVRNKIVLALQVVLILVIVVIILIVIDEIVLFVLILFLVLPRLLGRARLLGPGFLFLVAVLNGIGRRVSVGPDDTTSNMLNGIISRDICAESGSVRCGRSIELERALASSA
jgi:hypothetical protein